MIVRTPTPKCYDKVVKTIKIIKDKVGGESITRYINRPGDSYSILLRIMSEIDMTKSNNSITVSYNDKDKIITITSKDKSIEVPIHMYQRLINAILIIEADI